MRFRSHPGNSVPLLMAERPVLGRRHFLAGAGVSLFVSRPCFAKSLEARELSFDNIHTGEKLKVEYWAKGQYLPDALAEVNRLLRDFRTGQVHPISPELLDLLVRLRLRLETVQPVSVISGFRSPATNAMLRAEHEHSGVASKSLHMQGMAIDIRFAGRDLIDLHRASMAERRGGVGYYPASDFVHIDVGRVRSW
ncbi:MAG TPA: DUF882 domain-containing protein [Patescibacteria group bacterium]|nr:DUF882 domain-containing protein [Patescibacteria group bacterium]